MSRRDGSDQKASDDDEIITTHFDESLLYYPQMPAWFNAFKPMVRQRPDGTWEAKVGGKPLLTLVDPASRTYRHSWPSRRSAARAARKEARRLWAEAERAREVEWLLA